jgi:hypothetical protein
VDERLSATPLAEPSGGSTATTAGISWHLAWWPMGWACGPEPAPAANATPGCGEAVSTHTGAW